MILAHAARGFNPHHTITGIESLRTLKVAALACGLSDTQVEDVFFNNGAELFADRGIS
jgi:hypothetical protein